MRPRSRHVLLAPLALVCALALACSPAPDPEKRLEEARLLHDQGAFEEAVEAYTALIDEGYEPAQVWQYRADALTLLQRFDEAIVDYTNGIERDPNNPLLYNRRGEAYTWVGEYDKAIADYTRAGELAPGLYSAFSNRGDVYLHVKKDYEQALENYDRALEIYPDDCRALQGRFFALNYLGRAEDAAPDKERFDRLCASEE